MSVEINMSVDLGDTGKYLDRMPEKIKRSIGDALAKSAFLVERNAKMNAPVDTGRLRSSIITELTPSIYPTMAKITPFVNYAIFVHEGTRFIKANPFMTRAKDQSQGEVEKFFDDAIDDSLK